jgi:hypothetical protein
MTFDPTSGMVMSTHAAAAAAAARGAKLPGLPGAGALYGVAANGMLQVGAVSVGAGLGAPGGSRGPTPQPASALHERAAPAAGARMPAHEDARVPAPACPRPE